MCISQNNQITIIDNLESNFLFVSFFRRRNIIVRLRQKLYWIERAYIFFFQIFQKEKYNRQVEYARQVAEKNRVKLENSSRKVGPPRPKEDPVKEDLLDRRRIVSTTYHILPKAEEKNIRVSCNSTDPCQNPRPQKVFLTFRQKSVSGRVFHKIKCFALFSFYFWTAWSDSDCSITCKFVIKTQL